MDCDQSGCCVAYEARIYCTAYGVEIALDHDVRAGMEGISSPREVFSMTDGGSSACSFLDIVRFFGVEGARRITPPHHGGPGNRPLRADTGIADCEEQELRTCSFGRETGWHPDDLAQWLVKAGQDIRRIDQGM